jgi:putative ABC transport system permease protein
MTGATWLEGFVRDVRYALRTLAKTPTFTAAAVLTLGLGIGANTAIFSLVETVLLRSLPVTAPEDLVFLARDASGEVNTGSNYPYFERVRARTDAFAGVTAYDVEQLKVAVGGSIEMTNAQYVSGNYHAVLGVPMTLGRGFSSESDRGNADAFIAVISDAYWTRKLGRDRNVLGKTLVVEGRSVSIVGVTAPGFGGLQPGIRADVTIPLALRELEEPTFFTEHDTITSMPIVARLRPDVPRAQALTAVESVLREYSQEPEAEIWREWFKPPNTLTFLPAAQGEEFLRQRFGDALLVLMAVVGVVLVIGCANVATLVLARGSARAKDTAVRLSLGAPRARIVRQLLTESVLLAVGGGALGLLLASSGADLIAASFAVGERPILIDVRPNQTVLVFTSGVALLTVVLFGLVPALSATRVNVAPALKEGGIGVRDRWRAWSGRQVLVVAQIALSLVLLVGAGLLARTFWNLRTLDVGFDRSNVVMFGVDSESTSVTAAQLPQFCDQLLGRLRARPGAAAASCSVSVPVRGTGSTRALSVDGLPPTEQRDAFTNRVTADYFKTFGLSLLRGRLLADTDTVDSTKVVVVSERFAREYFGDDDPVGRTLRFGFRELGPPVTIVGVVGDTLQGNSPRERARRIAYVPLAQDPAPSSRVTIAVRTTEPAATLAPAARAEVRALNATAVVDYVRTMQQQIDESLVRERVLATLSSWFGGLALVLTCVGLYGVLSYDVRRRRRDIGIRLAVGAPPVAISRQFLWRSTQLAVAGIAVGVGAALATSRLLGSLLYGLGPGDPIAIGAAAAVLALTVIAAAYLPARRASQISPAVVLRAE